MSFPKSNYTYCNHDSIDELIMPSVDFWPIYSWSWMGEITEDGIIKQLDEMMERGIKRVYTLSIPSEFTGIKSKNETPYLSDEYLKRTEFLIKEVEKRGMKLWLYDEAGWPSGAANGRVVERNPHLQALSIDKNQKITKTPSLAQPYPDLLKAESTDRFIEYSHEVYKKHFGDTLFEHFAAIFTDEPHISYGANTKAWNDEIAAIFQNRFGYDIQDNLEALFDESRLDEHSRTVRADYHQLLGELFSENYFKRIKIWCDKNGILFTGHVGGDDVAFGNAKWGYYNILKCLRQMHIPGVDMIWRQAFPAPHMPGVEAYAPLCANTLFPRYASSSAHQTGARLSLTESYAIYGAGITYDQMRWVYNFQLVRGINVLNPMNISYTHAGKYAQFVGYPNFSSPAPAEADLKIFNLWAARASYVMSAGKPIADSALYMPMRDIWSADSISKKTAEDFEALGGELERSGCDIDVIDDEAILAAHIENGALCIGDAAYRVLYFQPNLTLSESLRKKLDKFERCSGKIVVCNCDYEMHPIVKDNSKSIRATRRTTAEGTIYYITNEAHEAKSGEVYFPLESAKSAYEINLLTSEKKTVSVNPYRYDLSLGGESVLLFTDKALAPEKSEENKYTKSIELRNFTLQATKSIKIAPEGLVACTKVAAPIAASVGDWCKYLGEYFSGDAEYKTTFSFNDEIPRTAILELGHIGYTCEVFLNGKSLGAKIFSPFIYTLSGLKKKNELVIRVSNTMANAYLGADYTKWIPDYEPDYMKKLELQFEKDSLESGLLTPALIRY